MNKVCSRCNIEKKLDLFPVARHSIVGPQYSGQCKACRSQYAKKLRAGIPTPKKLTDEYFFNKKQVGQGHE